MSEEVVVVANLEFYNWLYHLFKRLGGISRIEVTVVWVYSCQHVNQPVPVNVLGPVEGQLLSWELWMILHCFNDCIQYELLHGRVWQRLSADI